MSGLFLNLRRKLWYRFAGKFAGLFDPFAIVRNNLIEKPEFKRAFDAFDEHNFTEVLQVFRDLADQENSAAQYNLGIFYETGTGGLIRDDAIAEEWYRKAAEQGLVEAQVQLATIIAADAMAEVAQISVAERNNRYVEAYMWLLLADAQNYLLAAPCLRRLQQHMRDDQMAKAEEMAEEWQSGF